MKKILTATAVAAIIAGYQLSAPHRIHLPQYVDAPRKERINMLPTRVSLK
jgi:hypothetical protein